ncbi:MAG: APC family permease, partial [Planctomycetes bacterium]|nr:APC family permease [Planctomycetota bacterium]
MDQTHHKPSAQEASSFQHGVLGQLPATAICGNDITSSCLYVSALSIAAAGQWAPVSLLIVAAVLYLFRRIYAEVVGALPLNGGAYNALLNTTSKFRASVAACLTIL